MSQMQTVGKTISALRKAHDMTQMELADQLNISFQAVSNWERGSSMPDIAKLPQLAQLFGVTIDEILGEALEDVARLSLTHGSPEDLEGMLSFLSREALADLAKTALPQCGLEELEGFFSFLPHQTLAQLALEEYGRKDLDAVPEELLGYLHKEDLILLAQAVVKREGVRGLLPLADWLDKSAWAQLFQEGDR